MSALNEGDTVTIYGREAEVLRIAGKKMRLRYVDGGGITHDYVARHELPETCRDCDRDAVHRIEVNAPGNGDCYPACPDCAAEATGRRYISVHPEVTE
jgi:hypothetical protein